MGEWDDAILVGVVARTHGNRGEVVVNAETDFPEERFREGAQLMSRRKDGSPATLEVATMRMHQGRPVILFRGVASMNDAELLAGMELRVAEDGRDADRLEPGDEPVPDGIFAGKKSFRHHLINNQHGRRIGAITHREITALLDRNIERGKKTGRNG